MILRMAKGWRQSGRKHRRQLAFWSNKAQHAEELQSRKVRLSLDVICSLYLCWHYLPNDLSVTLSRRHFRYWPATPSIHRGLEWPQCLNSVSVCLFFACVFVSKFSNFFLFHPPLFIQYSTEECSTVQLLARDPEYPQRIRVASVFEFCVCLFFVCL